MNTNLMTMESQEINSGLCMRFTTLFLYRLNRISCLRRLRKHPGRILLVQTGYARGVKLSFQLLWKLEGRVIIGPFSKRG